MTVQKVQFEADHERLAGELILPNAVSPPEVLFLHGAGQSSKDRWRPLAQAVLKRYRRGSLIFDFPGHGESTGKLSASSLRQRLAVARAACDQFFVDGRPRLVIAFSMSGHTALELLADRNVPALALFCPAIYAQTATTVSFGRGFSEIIRAPDSWRRASVLENLRQYQGKLLIGMGTADAVIPADVVTAIERAAEATSHRETLWLPGIGHGIGAAMSEDPALVELILDKLGMVLPGR